MEETVCSLYKKLYLSQSNLSHEEKEKSARLEGFVECPSRLSLQVLDCFQDLSAHSERLDSESLELFVVELHHLLAVDHQFLENGHRLAVHSYLVRQKATYLSVGPVISGRQPFFFLHALCRVEDEFGDFLVLDPQLDPLLDGRVDEQSSVHFFELCCAKEQKLLNL